MGGVVAARSARVREVAAPRVPARPAAQAPAASARPLIDAVPSHILAASAPDRAPDPQRLARALDSAPRTPVTDDPIGGVAPSAWVPEPDAPPAFEPAPPADGLRP